MKLTTVVLSGGSGSRLWPASRESRPKPFIKLADGETLIQKTYARAKAAGSEVLTVTNRDYYFMSRDEQKPLGIDGVFLLEPFGRNTAPAIALAAKYIAESQSPETIMLVLAADHLIEDQIAFNAAVEDAKRLADDGYLVTFGIVPTSPETGFGYIEQGDDLTHGYKVKQFVEKPDAETANAYVASGNFLWNSGMFCFKAGALLAELEKHSSELSVSIENCWKHMQYQASADRLEIPAESFKDVPDISIDYAVMEKSSNVAVVRGDFGWNDVGSWNAIKDLVEPDAAHNRALGDAIFVESTGMFVQSEERLVATVGVNDLMIIDTADALLVAHKDKAQDVKKVVTKLKKQGHDAFKTHRTVMRPWGSYTVLEESPGFKIKRIEVKPGSQLSLQMHHHRSEHWIVVSGTAKITNGDKVTLVQANESTYIPAGKNHRLENPGIIPCALIEVQCGQYLGEDDIVRFDDVYGRV